MKTSKLFLTSLLAAAASLSVPAFGVTTTTTELDGVTYSGTIWTTSVSGVNSETALSSADRSYTDGTNPPYAGNASISGPGNFYNYFFKDSETEYVGNTLRLTGATENHTVTTDWRDYAWLGGLITDASDYTYTIGRSDTTVRLKGTSGVNMSINADTVIWGDRNNGAGNISGISVESNGSWVIATDKTLKLKSTASATFAAGTTTRVSGGGTLSFTECANVILNGDLSVGESTTLDLSGATVSLANAIQNSGWVTVSEGTVFNLTQTGETELITGSGTIAGVDWNTLTNLNFTYYGVGLDTMRSASVVVSTAGAVTLSYAAADLTWAGTSESSTWNTTNTNWTNGSSADSFHNYDNVTFGANAGVTTVTLENGADIRVGNMTVTGASYTFQPTTESASASISGNTLKIETDATLTSKTVNLLFDDIVLAGRLELDAEKFSVSALTWGRLTFNGGTLHIVDTQNASEFLSVREVVMTGDGTITSKWSRVGGTQFTIGTLSGTGDLSISGGTEQPITYSIGTLSGYSGTLTMQKVADKAALSVKITGTSSGNGANASFVVGSGVTLGVEGAYARFDWNKITLSDGATFKLLNGYGTSNNGHGDSEILIDAAGGSATIAGSLYGNGTNILGKIHGAGTLNVTSAESAWCNDLKISAVLADGVNDGDQLALTVNMGTGTSDGHVGTLTLTGNNTYSGGTTIAAGNLVAANANALGTGALSIGNGATLKIGVSEITINGLSGAAKTDTAAASKIALADGTASATVTLNITGEDSYSGYFDGNISLVKTGAGTLELTGNNLAAGGQNNTFSGTVEIREGTIKTDSTAWGSKGNLGTKFTQDGTVLKNGGVLEVTAAQNDIAQGGYGDGGAMRGFSVTSGEGTYRYTGAETSYIAPNLDDSGALVKNSHIGIADGATLIFDVTQDAATLEVSKVIASNAAQATTSEALVETTGALKKTGAGTLTLSGANLYSGGTTIEQGVLVAGSASALGTTKGVEVRSGATLNLGTSAVTVAGLSGAGAVGLAEGTASSTLTVTGGGVFSGTLSGGQNSLALVFDARGQTLELNPKVSNSLSSVEIKAGTVKTGNAFGLGGSQVSVQSAGALEFTASKTNDYGLMLGGITFAAGSSFVVDVTGASENDVLKIITSSTFQYYNGTGNVGLTSDNLDSFVNNFVTLNGWNGLADWSYENSVLSVTLTIPEPSVFGLLAGLGALALAGTRRRRRKA